MVGIAYENHRQQTWRESRYSLINHRHLVYEEVASQIT